MTHVPVLIVGGGPVGLAASLLLSRRGIGNLLVERHPGTAIHPKARGINARTMEIFRQQGVEAGVREAGLAPERTGMIVWAQTLAGEEIERRVPWRGRPAASTSPRCGPACAPRTISSPCCGASPNGRPPQRCASIPSSRHSSRTSGCDRDARDRRNGSRERSRPVHDRRGRRPEHDPPGAGRGDAGRAGRL